MGVFTDGEAAYLKEQILCRLATVNSAGQPQVIPTGFVLDEEQEVLKIGAHVIPGDRGQQRLYHRHIEANPQVAMVVDDVATTDPWTPRGVTVRGRAEMMSEGGEVIGPGFGPIWVRIVPTFVLSWGIDGDPFGPSNGRKVNVAS